ncbi:hypothetical protein MUN88_19125 [Gracilibacillus caseinilyticus]|uniref:Uncharacterized protein n=1 Tax=Gracilibacillus caseinilyticus TaxID=2932256 RepID=A0ABY4EWA0_9BACI|nr:hypothetical protein [Gracilibacillus caseinilyticus]UOQ48132.1 hypothetical protein MUN88_19125 [Gracilibacillus caseinilyticus]
MKCIIKMHEHSTYGAGKTVLVDAETYEPIFKHGGVITVTSEGYRLTTKAGEVIREGTETDAIQAVKALDFYIENLMVVDEVKEVELPYSDYLRKYGHGLIQRNNTRRFRYVTLTEDDATAFGIVERKENETIAFYSIYEPTKLTNRERTLYLLDYINDLLNAEDFAFINGHGVSTSHIKHWKNDRQALRLYATSIDKANKEALALAEDALQRKTTIIEKMEDTK